MKSTKREISLFVEFQNKLDREVVDEAKKGNSRAQDYLISKYENLVKAKAKLYFLIRADKKDIYQEGVIGLYKAIGDFKSDRLTSFKAFAKLYVTGQIITAIRTAARQKHILLNTYMSLNKSIYEEESNRTLINVLSGLKIANPGGLVIGKEQLKHIGGEMARVLSDLEMEVLQSYLDGRSYQRIACNLDRQAKPVDSALRRVKRKLEKYLYTEK